MPNKLMYGAMKIVDSCLGIKKDEKVLIITDYEIKPSISEVLKKAALSLGADVSVLTVAPGKKPGEEPAGLVRAAMAEADVIIAATSRTIMHSDAATHACNNGARLFTLTECTEDTLSVGAIEADYQALQPVFEKLISAFKGGSILHVTSPGGTNIWLDISDRELKACSGICTAPGCKMGFPDAEVYIAPHESLSHGTIVIDASSSCIGLVKEPIRIKVSEGKAVRIAGGIEAQQLIDILASTGESASYVVAEFAFGLNYKGKVVGNIIEDEGVYGTGHFALGNNLHFGGANKASIHIDMVYWEPTVELDGKLIMKNGKLVEEYLINELI